MRILINLVIVIIVGRLTYLLYKKLSKRSIGIQKHLNVVSSYDKVVRRELAKRDKTEKFLRKTARYTEDLKFLNHSEKRRENLEYISVRANRRVNGVELGQEHMSAIIDLISLAWIALMLILTVFNLKFIMLIPLYTLVDKIIILYFEKEIRVEDDWINKEFYKFYAPFYHTYKYPINRSMRVADVAKSHYSVAIPPIKRMIELLRADCQISEEVALDNLKNRYKISKVHRMSNQIKLIISGRSLDLTVLDGFQAELHSERRLEQKRALEIKKEIGMRVIQINVIILLEIIVYWSVMLVVGNAGKI